MTDKIYHEKLKPHLLKLIMVSLDLNTFEMQQDIFMKLPLKFYI